MKNILICILFIIGFKSQILAGDKRAPEAKVITKKTKLSDGMAKYEYTIHNLSFHQSIASIWHSFDCDIKYIPEGYSLFPNSIEYEQGKRFLGQSPEGWEIKPSTEDWTGPYGLRFTGGVVPPRGSVGGFSLIVKEDDNLWLEPNFCVSLNATGVPLIARPFVWNDADETFDEATAKSVCDSDFPDLMPDYDLVNKSEQCRKRVEIYDTRLANTRKVCFRKNILENRKVNITLHENLARLLAKVNAAPTNKEIKLKYDNLKNNILLNLSTKITEKNQLIEDRKVKLNEDISKAADLCK